MAELAAGAVGSLLSILRDEARRLGRVAGDVQFIQEEMESMNSFLLHLARTSPPGGEHDEQVRTWMNQVRVLAHDCSNCIDLYLYRGDPEIHRARGRLRRYLYLWWVPWFVDKLVAKRRAAAELSELKERARDVGERRQRYGVEIPGKTTVAGPDPAGLAASSAFHSHSPAAASEVAGDDDEDDGDSQGAGGDPPRRRALRSPVLENYFQRKLEEWLKQEVRKPSTTNTACTVAVVVTDTEDATDVAQQALDLAVTYDEDNVKWYVDISEAVELYGWQVLPYEEVLFYILRLIAKSKLQKEGAEGEEGNQQQDPAELKVDTDDEELENKIWENIDGMKIGGKIEKLKSKITSELPKVDKKPDLDGQSSTQPLVFLHHALATLTGEKKASSKNKSALEDIGKIAQKLKKYMEMEEPVEAATTAEKVPAELVQADTTGTEAGTKKSPDVPTHTVVTEVGTEKSPDQEPVRAHTTVTEEGTEKALEEPTHTAITEEVTEKASEEPAHTAVTEEGTENAPEEPAHTAVTEEGTKKAPEEPAHTAEAGEGTEKAPKEPLRAHTMVTEEGTEKSQEEPAVTKEGTQKAHEEPAHTAEAGEGTGKAPEEPLRAHTMVTEEGKEKSPEERAVTQEGTEKSPKAAHTAVIEEGTEKAHEEPPPKPNPICLHHDQYVHILQKLFPTSKSNTLQAKQQDRSAMQAAMTNTTSALAATPSTSTTSTSGEDQMKEIAQKFASEIVHEVLEYTAKKLVNSKLSQDLTTPDAIEQTREKIDQMPQEIEWQLFIKGMVDKICGDLGDKYRRTLIIIKDDKNYLDDWEETRNALSLLENVDGIVFVTGDQYKERSRSQGGEKYSSPLWEPITYSLSGLYHDLVLKLTSQRMDEDNTNKSQIIRDILEMCEPHEFCMKMFAHALVANPKRSLEELKKLHSALARQKTLGSIAKKMFKFSYSDLPKEFKSCLLYLAIFPRGQTIRTSTLVGRWVVEGLITKEDWPSSVHRAEQCIDALIDRWLVHPVDVVGPSVVKRFKVDDPVHEFITNIAKKQRIVGPRLSHHLARHFSIFNDVRLCRSDRIDNFLKNPSESSQWSRIKVLDLERCQCFKNNQRYLKDICRKLLLLKYLSLRGTDIAKLPREINELHELEVLDIRETEVPPYATKLVLLMKLKRFLAGDTKTKMPLTGAVWIPNKIKKMINMEVLSNVEASKTSRELKDIGKLAQLRKLGVVINDTDNDLSDLLHAIGNVHESLQSLSITVTVTTTTSTGSPATSTSSSPTPTHGYLPKGLERLSIKGSAEKVHILPLLLKDPVPNKLTKVNLSSTSMNEEDLNVLSEHHTLQCVRLRDIAYTAQVLNIKKDGFKHLNYFLVEGSNMTGIEFEEEAAPMLEKIVLSSTGINSVCGVEYLPKLEELELNHNKLEELELNHNNKLLSSFDKAQKITKVILRDDMLKQDDVQTLAKKSTIRCLVLEGDTYDQSILTFNKDEFPMLNLLSVDCPSITRIKFCSGFAPKLEKIVWSFIKIESLSDIGYLPKLKELELNGDLVPNEVKQDIILHPNRHAFNFKHNKPEHQNQETGNVAESRGHVGGFKPFWKKWH